MGLFDKEIKTNPNEFVASVDLSADDVNIPKLEETTTNKWVNYGADNRYAEYLVDLTRRSALHRTILENKAKMTTGADILVNGTPLKDWINGLTGPTSIRIQNLFFNSQFPLRDWLKRCAYDYQIFGAFTTETIWNTDFEYVKVLKHIDTSKVRSGVMNNNGEVDRYFYARDWQLWNPKNVTAIAAFNTDDNKNMNQLIYKKDYTPNLFYYAEPSYVGGLQYINLDAELGTFNLSHVKNGFNPGLIFKVPFTFQSAEEKAAFMREFFNHYRGARNNKNPLILAKNGEMTWEIEKVDVPGYDAQLTALGDFIVNQLIFAHRVTNGALVGLLQPGKIGNSNAEELEFSKKTFDAFVIEPARLMLEEVLEQILRTHGLNVEIKIIN
jgi:hypothetical protein